MMRAMRVGIVGEVGFMLYDPKEMTVLDKSKCTLDIVDMPL